MLNTATVLLIMAALGFQWGYQPTDGETLEYVIQLSPQEAQHLASSPGVEFTSYVPQEAQPVGRIRLTVGDGPLPREAAPDRLADTRSTPAGDNAKTDPAPAEQEGAITETQSRVAKISDGGAERDAASRGDLDRDLAGKLVAVSPLPGETRAVELPEGLQLTAQDGAPVQTEDAPPPSGDQAAATQASTDRPAADPPQSELPDGITQPVYTTSRPTQEGQPEVDLSAFAGDSNGDGRRVQQETSPSDRPDEEAGNPQDRSQPNADADRPWLPLVGAIAVACGFLAGNVFQWRSYMSLRKRYLRLLRKTGG